MNTVNFSKNTISDVLKKAKQVDTAKAQQDNKAKIIAKHLAQIENTGMIDAINYAPKREWKHLFTHTPISDYINKSFTEGLNDQRVNTNLKALEEVQGQKQVTKSIRNIASGIAVGAGIAAATLTPLGHMAGLGYLAGWANTALATSIMSGMVGAATQAVNVLELNKEEQKHFNDFTGSLNTYAKNNITDMHKYWNAVDKLSKLPMREDEALQTLSSLYTEANNKLREKRNISLVDVYLTDNQKNNLKNYKTVDYNSLNATHFHKNMTELPTDIPNPEIYREKWRSFVTVNPNDNNPLHAVIGFKLHVLENIGVSVDRKDLSDTPLTAKEIDTAINKKYGQALDDAILIYQGKNTMVAPLIEKVEKVLQGALEAFSQEAVKQAKAQNLKKVPEITGKLVEQVLSVIMLQTSIPANDPKLTKILNAIANNTALKVSANLNNYANDTAKAIENKALYAGASLDNLYNYDSDAFKTQALIKRLSKKGSLQNSIGEAFTEKNLKTCGVDKFVKFINSKSKKFVHKPYWRPAQDDVKDLRVARARWLPIAWANKPFDMTKEKNRERTAEFLKTQ